MCLLTTAQPQQRVCFIVEFEQIPLLSFDRQNKTETPLRSCLPLKCLQVCCNEVHFSNRWRVRCVVWKQNNNYPDNEKSRRAGQQGQAAGSMIYTMTVAAPRWLMLHHRVINEPILPHSSSPAAVELRQRTSMKFSQCSEKAPAFTKTLC